MLHNICHAEYFFKLRIDAFHTEIHILHMNI